jgi:predicted metalloendopeptidase
LCLLFGQAWLDRDTKTKALEKLSAMTNKIGHPDLKRVMPEIMQELLVLADLSDQARCSPRPEGRALSSTRRSALG